MFVLNALKRNLLIGLSTCAIIGMSSCENKAISDIVDDVDDDLITVTLNLQTGSTLSRTGADVSDLSGVGTYEENFVDPSKLHVYFCDESQYTQFGGMMKKELDVCTVKRIDSSTYRVCCTTDALPTTTNFRVVVTANWQSTPVTNSTIFVMNASNGADFPYNYGTTEAMYYDPAETPIPMFGVKKYPTSDFTGHSEINIGSISLIRAMAKILVKSTAGDEIESVTLTRCLNVGMSGPCGIYNDSGTETLNPSSTDNLNIPGKTSSRYNKGRQTLTNLPFKDLGDNRFLIYIPGYDNVNDGASALTIRMADCNKDHTVSFTDNGTAFNLMRNYMYVYDVYLDRSQLNYVVTACDDYTSADIAFD